MKIMRVQKDGGEPLCVIDEIGEISSPVVLGA